MMRRQLAALFALCALLAIPALFCANETAANATGGYVTQTNLTFVQNSDRWVFYYGNATSASTSSISVNGTALSDLSDSSHLVYLVSTYQMYLISESDNTVFGQYQAANLTAFDADHSLSGVNAAGQMFNETSNFSMLGRDGASAGTLALPTAYFPGYASDGTADARAFREGLAVSGGSYLFVVPANQSIGFDHRRFDYEFALPYRLLGQNQVYVYSVSAPSSGGGGSKTLPSIGYSWSYDGKTLTIKTEPGASVFVHDALGKAYNFVADLAGLSSMPADAGATYSVRFSLAGFSDTQANIYIPVPTAPPSSLPSGNATGPAPVNSTALQSALNESLANPSQLIARQTADGLILCSAGECYLRESSQTESLQLLSELSCEQGVCKFMGNVSELARKYKFSKTSSLVLANRAAGANQAFNLSAGLAGIGPAISAQFEQIAKSDSPASGPLVLGVILVCIAIGFFLFMHSPSAPKMRGGYD